MKTAKQNSNLEKGNQKHQTAQSYLSSWSHQPFNAPQTHLSLDLSLSPKREVSQQCSKIKQVPISWPYQWEQREKQEKRGYSESSSDYIEKKLGL